MCTEFVWLCLPSGCLQACTAALWCITQPVQNLTADSWNVTLLWQICIGECYQTQAICGLAGANSLGENQSSNLQGVNQVLGDGINDRLKWWGLPEQVCRDITNPGELLHVGLNHLFAEIRSLLVQDSPRLCHDWCVLLSRKLAPNF